VPLSDEAIEVLNQVRGRDDEFAYGKHFNIAWLDGHVSALAAQNQIEPWRGHQLNYWLVRPSGDPCSPERGSQ